ncbi:pilus assembly protein [Lacisediminimonas profundi]|uniref:pilus assembly protein n=1 Tax=Lacisediminimonas profundi TaxID=2603856 RepID=UPI00124B395B|nr:PilC/PilY family type IV pilus protein [Lacisediminimonas profundi]
MLRVTASVGAMLLAAGACAQPVVDLAQTHFDSRAVVPALLVLALEPGYASMESSWPGEYAPVREYEGYFHHGKCYRFSGTTKGYFTVESNADASHYCNGGAYSGNFLNWAGMTVIDTLRYGLAGGYRTLDSDTATLLERADVGARGAVASLRKSVAGVAAATSIGRLTPFNVAALYLQSCGNRLLLSERPIADDCRKMAGNKLLADLPLRVKVCDEDEADRNWLCVAHGTLRKPEGALHRAAAWLRVALLSGAAREATEVPARFIGVDEVLPASWIRQPNKLAEWDEETGIHSFAGGRRGGVLQNLYRHPPANAGQQPDSAYRKSLDYLAKSGTGSPIIAACQLNVVLHLATGPAAVDAVAEAAVDAAGAGAGSSVPTSFRRRIIDGRIEWHGTIGGMPERYHATSDGEQLLAALRRVFAGIAADVQAAAIPPAAAVALAHGDDLYLAAHETRTWSGGLRRYRITHAPDGTISHSSPAEWESSIPLASARRIYTLGADAQARIATIPLQWDALSAAQQRLLGTSVATGRVDGRGVERVAWMRGDRQVEEGKGGSLRPRLQLMGDVVNANLVLVPAAAGADLNANAAATVFAGANDGLLHAFDAASGSELFAYLPAALLHKIPALTAPGQAHQAFVDGGLAIGRADVAGSARTVLAGSFGRGGRGVFALDVSDIRSFGSATGAIFEFTEADDAAMGHVLGAPHVVRIGIRKRTGNGVGEGQFVLAQGGINSSAAMFLIALDKPADQQWSEGLNYFRITAAADGVPASRHLGPPALVTGNDGRLLHAYAGDIAGNLWRFSFTPDRSTDSGFRAEVALLFRALNGDGQAQPVTSAPRVVHASGSGYIVLFGTGKMLEHADAAPGSARIESLYAVLDRPGLRIPATRASLAPRRARADGSGYRVTGEPFIYGEQIRGWFLDLPARGERVLAAPVLAAGRMQAASVIAPGDPCLPADSRVWNLDVLSGLSGSAGTGLRMAPALLRSPLVLQSRNESGKVDAFGRRESNRVHSILYQEPGAAGRVPDARQAERGPSGRLSWREIFNWKQMQEEARGRQ